MFLFLEGGVLRHVVALPIERSRCTPTGAISDESLWLVLTSDEGGEPLKYILSRTERGRWVQSGALDWATFIVLPITVTREEPIARIFEGPRVLGVIGAIPFLVEFALTIYEIHAHVSYNTPVISRLNGDYIQNFILTFESGFSRSTPLSFRLVHLFFSSSTKRHGDWRPSHQLFTWNQSSLCL